MSSSADLGVASSRAVAAGMIWLAGQAPGPGAAQAGWSSGAAAAVPVGRAFAVVRVTDGSLGPAAFNVLLTQAPRLLGPVIADREGVLVDFLIAVPPVWQSAGTVLLAGSRDSPYGMQCPPADREASGRRWLNAPCADPGCAPVLTDPQLLGRALTAARLQLIRAGHRFTA
ncbi:hypothetical protein [Kitasatospora griseola]|uniref:hypothetical protein n=1 Tax=Kitasatospora griseola TaxID=2064 RepID=UPI0037F46D5A